MDRWMNSGWWMDGGTVDGWTDTLVEGRMDGWVNGGWVDRQNSGCMNGWRIKSGQVDRWMHGWVTGPVGGGPQC